MQRGEPYVAKLLKLLGDTITPDNPLDYTDVLGIKILQEITDSLDMKNKMIELGAIKMVNSIF